MINIRKRKEKEPALGGEKRKERDLVKEEKEN